jgi:hypothetical protein
MTAVYISVKHNNIYIYKYFIDTVLEFLSFSGSLPLILTGVSLTTECCVHITSPHHVSGYISRIAYLT